MMWMFLVSCLTLAVGGVRLLPLAPVQTTRYPRSVAVVMGLLAGGSAVLGAILGRHFVQSPVNIPWQSVGLSLMLLILTYEFVTFDKWATYQRKSTKSADSSLPSFDVLGLTMLHVALLNTIVGEAVAMMMLPTGAIALFSGILLTLYTLASTTPKFMQHKQMWVGIFFVLSVVCWFLFMPGRAILL